ncbi:MAG: alpha/beta hydrolase [Gammaproteobacteria bacterium]|nr:alpha/beta hydrolase [Gammaproteobacteria bacterium]
MFHRTTLALALCALFAACSRAPEPERQQDSVVNGAANTGPVKVAAPDGVEIAATVHSSGEPSVVLVHGWMCDQTYWEAQVPALSEHFGVVTVDMAGHGLSGVDREAWTIESLGEDVAAVISDLQLENVAVIGHSMGGRVGLEVARLLPGGVVGVIGVDTLHDADEVYDPDEVAGLLAGFETDFVATCGAFVGSMFGEQAPESVITEIRTDMCGGPGAIGTALIRDYVAYDLAAALQAADVPVRSINADKWPTNVPANRKYADFDAVILEGYGHFLMQEAPGELNAELIKTVTGLTASGAR